MTAKNEAIVDDPPDRTIPTTTIPIFHWGRWLSAIIVLLLGVGIVYIIAGAQIDYRIIPTFLTSSTLLHGVVNTLYLAFASMLVAASLGIVLAMMRISPNPVSKAASSFYLWAFRGPPSLLQIYLWYNLALIIKHITIKVPFTDFYLIHLSVNDFMTPFMAALLGIGLNEAAFMAEIYRGGINSVSKGQREAAQAVGMSHGQALRRVILPQAMRFIIPPSGNQFILMLKETSLAAPITYLELTHAAQNISSINLLVMEALIAAALWYMVVVSIASIGQSFIERHFDESRGPVEWSQIRSRVVHNLRTPIVWRRRSSRS